MTAFICYHPTQNGYKTLSTPNANNILYFVNTDHQSGCEWYLNVPPTKIGSYDTDRVKAVVKIDGEYLAFDCSHGLDKRGRPLFRYEEDMEDFFDFHREVLSQIEDLDTLTESVVSDLSHKIVDEEEPKAEPRHQVGSYSCGSKSFAEQEGFATHNNTTHHCIEINGAVETVTLKLWDGSTMVIGLCSNISGTKTTRGVRFCDIKTTLKGEVTVDGKLVKLNGKLK